MAKSSGRDNFSAKTRRDLAARAGHVCSFPGCNQPTSGPSAEGASASADVGEACHISAAAEGRGARRYDSTMSSAERKSIANGIWMCRTHAKLIDSAARSFSLLEADGDALSMHRLVQAITRDRCDPDERRYWSQAVVALLNAAYLYDPNDLATRELAGRLLPHVRAVMDRLDGVETSKPASRLLNETGLYLLHRGVVAEARRHLEQSLEIDERV